MMRYLHLVGVQLRVSAAAAMQYRANFFIEGVMSGGGGCGAGTAEAGWVL